MITTKIIADSINEYDNRLITIQLQYPRYIHSEFMTHRAFSRNASSSRAIPTTKLVMSEIVEPIRWGCNIPGMQASEHNLEGKKLEKAKKIWKRMAEVCSKGSQELFELGLHKQWANRPVEWFTHINVIVTSTEWINFFALRRHPDAQPEIRALADEMYNTIDESTPKLLKEGEWHLPYIREDDKEYVDTKSLQFYSKENLLIRCSVARCARVSYVTHEFKTPTTEEDLKLYDRLVNARPPHMSPAEHQATPDVKSGNKWENRDIHGNFVGWMQYRKMLGA